jgi:hypothetical protein
MNNIKMNRALFIMFVGSHASSFAADNYRYKPKELESFSVYCYNRLSHGFKTWAQKHSFQRTMVSTAASHMIARLAAHLVGSKTPQQCFRPAAVAGFGISMWGCSYFNSFSDKNESSVKPKKTEAIDHLVSYFAQGGTSLATSFFMSPYCIDFYKKAYQSKHRLKFALGVGVGITGLLYHYRKSKTPVINEATQSRHTSSPSQQNSPPKKRTQASEVYSPGDVEKIVQDLHDRVNLIHQTCRDRVSALTTTAGNNTAHDIALRIGDLINNQQEMLQTLLSTKGTKAQVKLINSVIDKCNKLIPFLINNGIFKKLEPLERIQLNIVDSDSDHETSQDEDSDEDSDDDELPA